MAAKPVMSIIAAKAAVDAATVLLNAGGAGSLKIYTGAQPASTLASEAGTLLSTLPLSATAFPPSTSGTSDGLVTATANAITSDTNAAASGTAGHFRMQSGGGTVIFQGNVAAATADLIMNTVSFTAGDTISITSFKITLPCGDGVS